MMVVMVVVVGHVAQLLVDLEKPVSGTERHQAARIYTLTEKNCTLLFIFASDSVIYSDIARVISIRTPTIIF